MTNENDLANHHVLATVLISSWARSFTRWEGEAEFT